MTLSSKQIGEIAYLYESIAAYEQEQLDEGYISEQGRRPGTPSTASQTNQSVSLAPIGNAARSVASVVSNSFSRANSVPNSGGSRNMRGGGTRPAAAKPAPTPAAAKPAPTPAAAKPAPVSSPKVVPTKQAATPAKPAMGTTAGGTKFERRAATSAELKAAQDARAAAKASGNTKGAEEAAVKAGVNASKSTLKQSFEYDAYDLVLEYLLDNGHVDTVDEAHYVMMELDAEVIQDIVEEVLAEDANYDRNRRRAAQRAAARNAARDAGKTGAVPGVGYVTPRRESETYRDSTGTERHKSGAKMPEKKG